jgi:GNAT superfamily N-acetyltransferase
MTRFRSQNAFVLRPAVAEDIPALRRLIERSVRQLQRQDYSPAQIEGALGHALGVDTQLIEDGTYFVAEARPSVHAEGGVDGESGEGAASLAGCGGWSRRRTLFGSDHGPHREADFLDPAVDAAKIRAIFVDPAWARRGLGGLILRHCEQAAQAAGFMHLEMGSTLTGVPLYTMKGYVETARVDVPLPNGEVLPIVRMRKSLQH